MKHAFYSAKQADLGGIIIWRTPDGKDIRVTEVCDQMEQSSSWPDKIYLGKVNAFVKRVSWGICDILYYNKL